MTAELVTANSGAVAERNQQTIVRLMKEIEKITTVEQAAEASAVVRGIHAYAEAQRSLELVNQAIELRIWAERKGGQAIATNGDKFSTLLKNHGIQYTTAQRWLALYYTDVRLIRSYIDRAKEENRTLNVASLIKHSREAGRKKIAPGVYKDINGTFSIEWKEINTKRTRRGFTSKEDAINKREQMVRMAPYREKYPKRNQRHSPVTVAYSHLRRALDAAQEIAANKIVDDAMQYMYKAEDLLSRATRGEVE